MITIKLLGGAKKIFATDKLELEFDNHSLSELLDYLLENKPNNSPDFDVNNILIAVNGIDSSAIDGKNTKLSSDDIVTIIPVIHGGSRIQLKYGSKNVELFQIKKNSGSEINLDSLRLQFPKLLLQGISSKFLLGKSHAQKIIYLSIASKSDNLILAKKIETDILMRFACTNQISQAISKVGINQKDDFVIIAIGTKANLNKIFQFLKPYLRTNPLYQNNSNFLKKEFSISKQQLECIDSKTPLEDILVEKASVLF